MQVITRYRLIADEGKILVKGNLKGSVIDCSEEDKDSWKEEDYIDEERQRNEGNPLLTGKI